MLGSYYPYQSANGVCVQTIVDKLKDEGNEIQILCYGEDDAITPFLEKPYIHTISAKGYLLGQTNQKKQYSSFIILLSRFKTILYLPFHPVLYLGLAVRFYKMGRKLDKQNNFDCIISVMRPMEAVLAGYWLKKKRKSLKYFIYELDTMTDDDLDISWRRHLGFLSRFWERKFYRRADCVFHMKGHEKHFSGSQYNRFYKKFRTMDIPMLSDIFTINTKKGENLNSSEFQRIVYAGSLISIRFSPVMVINVVEELIKQVDIQVEFYSRGDCEQMLIEAESRTNGAIQPRGYVPQDELNSILANADFLISIGNSSSTLIPGKTFMYMAFGKPIIHFYSHDEDLALNYLRKYPFTLLLNQNDSVMDNAKLLHKFIMEKKGKSVSFTDVEKLFYECTPKYSAMMIMEAIE